ncbi:MAG TPA: carboxymuconolactone decarboxylase family protein [Myxococcota bacterium]
MSWLPLPATAAGRDPFERVFALRPNLFEAWRDFAALFWSRRLVDPVVLELCRLRVAQLLEARHPQSVRTPEALAAGLSESRIAGLASWWTRDDFSPTERACLRFAEQFVLDAKGISDADAAAVVGALGDAGTVAFVEALAIFDGFSRFCCSLDVEARA